MEEIIILYPEAKEMQEAGHSFIFLPTLGINGKSFAGLLCLTPRDGYPSRLFLSERVAKEGNWTCHQILGREWHTLSWKIEQSMRPAELLAEHTRAYR